MLSLSDNSVIFKGITDTQGAMNGVLGTTTPTCIFTTVRATMQQTMTTISGGVTLFTIATTTPFAIPTVITSIVTTRIIQHTLIGHIQTRDTFM